MGPPPQNFSAKPSYIGALLRPRLGILTWAFLASVGEAAANLAEPWPIKIVLDNVLQKKPAKGWLANWVSPIYHSRSHSFLWVAVAAVIVIAVAGAIFSY